MTDQTEPIAHIERRGPDGQPTGHAMCDATDGRLARNSGNATCEECARILGDGNDDPEDEAGE